MSTEGRDDSPIEAYLDALTHAAKLLPPRELRSILAETEAHLRDAADAATSAGTPRLQAEQHAVARFGPPSRVVAAEHDRLEQPWPVIATQLAVGVWRVGSIGAIAIGVSGCVAALIKLVGGATFLAGTATGTRLNPADCARWLALSPGAATCRDAAVADWAGEVIWYRLAVGLLGVAALIGLRFVRRGLGASDSRALPRVVSDSVMATSFAAAAAIAGVLAIGLIVNESGHGAGQWLSAAVVAVIGAAAYAARILGELRSGDLENATIRRQ